MPIVCCPDGVIPIDKVLAPVEKGLSQSKHIVKSRDLRALLLLLRCPSSENRS